MILSLLVSTSRSIGSNSGALPIVEVLSIVEVESGSSPQPQSYSSVSLLQSKSGFFSRSFTLLWRAHNLEEKRLFDMNRRTI